MILKNCKAAVNKNNYFSREEKINFNYFHCFLFYFATRKINNSDEIFSQYFRIIKKKKKTLHWIYNEQ